MSSSTSDAFGEEGIKKVKQIIESFSKKIDSVKGLEQEPEIIRENCDREESGNSEQNDFSEFRKIMFSNAKNKDDNFIVAEKKKW